jgi:hypothetical protein
MALTYSYNVSTNAYAVIGGCGDATVIIPASHNDGEHGELDVIEIEADAFQGCTSLTSITIPNSVTSIGDSAFAYTKVNNVIIPNSVINIGQQVFEGCSSLSNITIGNNVQSIGGSCFLDSAISSIVFPDSVTSVGAGMFEGCSSLKNVIFGNGITSIPGSFFYGCLLLSQVTFGSGVTTIGAYTFYQCTSLKKINIPNKLTTIPNYAFYRSGLEELNIPENVTSIGDHAFEECNSLKTVTIGKGQKSLGNYSFTLSPNLTRMNFLGNLRDISISSFAFGDGNNPNLKFYRYSTSAGWPPVGNAFLFDAYEIEIIVRILLIDTVSKSLSTFGFPNVSLGKASIKKQNLGSGKISLFFDTLPLNTQRIRLNLGYTIGGCGNDFVLMQNGVWSQNGCDFYVRWDNKNGTLPYRWRFFYSSDGRTDFASHPTAGPDSLPKKGWSNRMTISENQLITFGQSLVVNNFQSDPDGNCDFSSLNGTWIYLGAPSFKYRSINAQIYYINTPLTPGEYGGNGLYQIQDSDEVYFTNSYSNSDKFPSNNWQPAAYIINNCPQITTTPVFSLL